MSDWNLLPSPPGGPPPGGYGPPPGAPPGGYGPPPGGYGAPPGGYGPPPYGTPPPPAYGQPLPYAMPRPGYVMPPDGSLKLGLLAGLFGCLPLVLVLTLAKGAKTRKGAWIGFVIHLALALASVAAKA